MFELGQAGRQTLKVLQTLDEAGNLFILRLDGGVVVQLPILQVTRQRLELANSGPQSANLLILGVDRGRPLLPTLLEVFLRVLQLLSERLVLPNLSQERGDLPVLAVHQGLGVGLGVGLGDRTFL